MPATATKSATATHDQGAVFRSLSQHKVILGLLLVVVTLALYNPVSRNGFINFDDDRYVTDNAQVRTGIHWSTVSWAFSSFDQANWHPLTWLSHALDCGLFGLNPAGHHYVNLLLHVMNAMLLFLILQWLTGSTGRSFMVAALFAVHPLNVESVAWVAERKNVLSMFFLLLTIAAYGWYVRATGRSILRYLSVTVLFALSLMSKPMAITLPFVLLLLDYWPLGRFGKSGTPSQGGSPVQAGPNSAAIAEQHDSGSDPAESGRSFAALVMEKLPLFVLSAASALITMIAQRAGGAVLTSAAHSPILRLENVIVCYALYIKKMFWPSHLAVMYPYPHVLPIWEVVVAAAFLIAISLLVLKYRERRYVVVGWLWYLGTMVPMIGLIQVGNQSMADRYAYLPLIGLFIMVVWTAADWCDSHHPSEKYLAAAAACILIALSAATRMQIGYWHDDLSLWSRALAVTGQNYVAENSFAYALTRQGRIDEAAVHFRNASAIEPADATSQLNLGIYAQDHGDLGQARARYELVLQLATDTQLRGAAYANLGGLHFATRDYPAAQQNFEAAIRLKRVFPFMLLDMGLMAEKNNDWNHAIGYFGQLVVAQPTDVGYLLLANAFRQAGRTDEAESAFQQALRVSVNIAQAQLQAAQMAAQ